MVCEHVFVNGSLPNANDWWEREIWTGRLTTGSVVDQKKQIIFMHSNVLTGLPDGICFLFKRNLLPIFEE